jgi:sugar/nucleoside kinase (ribokinase family)
MSDAMREAVECVTAAVPGTVFYSEDGTEALVLLNLDPYVVRVDADENTESAYLVTMPPAEIAKATGAGEGEIGGFAAGWTC